MPARSASTSGLAEIRSLADRVLAGGRTAPAVVRGTRSERNLLDQFIDHVMTFVDPTTFRSLRVVADIANGMGGLVVPAAFERLDALELEVMFPELDGTFPNHPADPLQPANQRDLRARVVSGGFDIGLAFDGDADRVFVVDETGHGLSGSTTTAVLAAAVLRTDPGATVLYNLICSRAVPETIREHGGIPVRTKVGHSYIKQIMLDTGAIFGGEHSAHYYFARNYRADSGLIASLLVINELVALQRRPVGAAQAVRALRGERRDQHPRRRRRRRHRRRQRGVLDVLPGPPRRADGRLRLVVVQPAPVEHRAPAAAQPRGRHPRRLRRPCGRVALAHHPRLAGGRR